MFFDFLDTNATFFVYQSVDSDYGRSTRMGEGESWLGNGGISASSRARGVAW